MVQIVSTPPRTRRKEARPAELLEAATQLFVEKGYAATRVEEVAALAKVSKGTLFCITRAKKRYSKQWCAKTLRGVLQNGKPNYKISRVVRQI